MKPGGGESGRRGGAPAIGGPLAAAEFARLMAPLGPFEPAPLLAVATSGGADSLALALLAAEWAQARGGEAVALTVDHRLRPDSAAEAARVAGWLAARGISHTTLAWTGPKPTADVQAAARAARYRLLGDWCAGQGVLHLLLAHHRDDQAETLLLRLGRGSGVDGLAAMAAAEPTRWGRLLRPVLPVPRTRLEATLAACGQEWIDDPSNRNPAFARVRLRGLLPVLAAEGLTPARLAATAARLGRARAALEAATAAAACRHVRLHPAGFAEFDPAGLAALPTEIALRLLARMLLAVGGKSYPPRLERLEGLRDAVRRDGGAGRTLAGCRLVAGSGGGVLICREAAQMAGPLPLPPGEAVEWDGRFRLALAAGAPAGLSVRALGRGHWQRLARALAPRPMPAIPPPVRPTLPVIADEDGIFAVPHLGYNRSGAGERALRWIVPSPANPLTVAGRCLVPGGDGIISRATHSGEASVPPSDKVWGARQPSKRGRALS